MKTARGLSILICLAVATSLSGGYALAQVTDGGRLAPELGPVEPNLTPGVGGYKIYGPDAIKKAPALKDVRNGATSGRIAEDSATDSVTSDPMRYGYSDVYKATDTEMRGSHNSQSDLVEQSNWVDGAIRELPNAWYDSCSNHSSGQFASCNSTMPEYQGSQTYSAYSWHHFHLDGYTDTNLETEDRMTT